MDLVAYLLGVGTIPAILLVAALVEAVMYALSRDYGYGPCEICEHLGGRNGHDIGERTNLRYWIDTRLHFWIWARRPEHKVKRGAAYLEKADKGWHMARPWDKRFMSRP